MKVLQRDIVQNYSGGGYNPNQQTFILMWNPAISSYTIHNHIDSIAHIDDWKFNWSVYEWEKAHKGDRFFMVRVGDGNTGIVMSGIFISEPYTSRDWNRIRKTKEIHYMNMQPNFIVNPETMPTITTEQLQEAIPDFEWRRGHSGVLVAEHQARKLEALFSDYLSSVSDRVDEENLAIKQLMDSNDLDCINAVLQLDADKFFHLIEQDQFASHLLTDTQLVSGVNFPLHYISICWDAILNKYEEYVEDFQEVLSMKKIENDRIKDCFEKTFGLQMNELPWEDYRDCFYCADPEDTIEDFVFESESDLLKRGCKQMDIDLFCSIHKMNFETTKRLLEAGANPEAIFETDDEDCDNGWEMICYERDYLEEKLCKKFKGNEVTPFERYEVEYLIGYVAYDSMYSLLKPYIKISERNKEANSIEDR